MKGNGKKERAIDNEYIALQKKGKITKFVYPAIATLYLPHASQGFTYSTYSDPLDIGLFGGGFRLNDDRGNTALRPAEKTEWEIGADLRLFSDRLTLGMTYYQNEIVGDHIDVIILQDFLHHLLCLAPC